MFKRIKQKIIIKEFENESDKVKRLLNDKHILLWEYLLTAELLSSRITDIKFKYDELDSTIKENKIIMTNERDFIIWAASLCDKIISMLETISDLVDNKLQRAWGAPGKPGDALKIKNVIDQLYQLYIKLLKIEIDIRSIEPPKRFCELRESMKGITLPLFEPVHKFAKDFGKFISKIKYTKEFKGEHVFTINWDVKYKVLEIQTEITLLKLKIDDPSIDNYNPY